MFILRRFLVSRTGGYLMESNELKGTLYICATPIGNLADITLRALQMLREADLVAAEDTRHTRKLFSHFDIHTPLTSYHEHNRQVKEKYLLERLLAGQNIVLVSDAGTPGISDPGEDLICAALEQGIRVTALPGASALLTALNVSGLPLSRFVFEGFLPASKKERRARLAKLAGETRTIVIYESPHHLLKTLDDLAEFLGESRKACAARELTKLYEDVQRSTLAGLRELFSSAKLKGEFVLVISGRPEKDAEGQIGAYPGERLSLEEYVNLLKEEGVPPNSAIKIVSRLNNISRRELYDIIHKHAT